MNRQKLISMLQSRIAKRKAYLGTAWQLYSEIKAREEHYQAHHWKVAINNVGEQQKQDKTILKQLIWDERQIKRLCFCAATLQSRIDTLLGWDRKEK